MISRRAVLALATLLLLPVPLRASEPALEDIYAAFERLLGTPQDRVAFGLPPDRTWRVSKEIMVIVAGKQHGAAALRAFAKQLSDQTGIVFEIVDLSLMEGAEGETIYLAPATVNTTGISVLPRKDGAVDARKRGAAPEMLARFESGQWPFVFHMKREANLFGIVWIAEDEPPATIEASLALALISALGGVTLGEQLQGLVEAGDHGPTLTPLGAEVFTLMYHPELKTGLPLDRVKAHAQEILGLTHSGRDD